MEPSTIRSQAPATARPRLLVVDDDAEIGAMLSTYLASQGLQVSVVADGAQLRSAMRDGSFDLVLLDLGLPDEDGLTLIRDLRERWHGPVIIISGRGESVERILGLELGADDYVTKPFDLRELLARIRSVLRRSAPAPDDPPVQRAGYDFDGLLLDIRSRRLLGRDREEIAITSGEFELLLVLLRRPGVVLSRDQLMNGVHGRDAGPFDRAIDVQIGRLRRKIESDPADPKLIKSVRGAGYLFTGTVRSI